MAASPDPISTVIPLMSKHMEFVPYISFDSIIDNSRPSNLNASHLDVIGKLTTFYNLTLLASRPKLKLRTHEFHDLTNSQNLIFHKMLFIERKIFRIKSKDHQRSVEFLGRFLQFLQDFLLHYDRLDFNVNIDTLCKDLTAPSSKSSSLNLRYSIWLRELEKQTESPANPEKVRLDFASLISTIASSVDPTTSYLHLSELQSRFETILFSSSLPYGAIISDLVLSFPTTKPQVFIQSVFDTVLKILADFKIVQRHADSALVILLYRVIFERVYAVNPYFFEDGDDVISKLSKTTVGDLALPTEFCPPMKPSDLPRDIFRNDRLFSPAVSMLEETAMYTNPFDILHCIHEALTVIEVAATHYCGGQAIIFPFEVTFGLFLAVTLSSQVKNLVNMARFVDVYTPPSGLCPAFEYARAKILACSVQCQEISANGPNNSTK